MWVRGRLAVLQHVVGIGNVRLNLTTKNKENYLNLLYLFLLQSVSWHVIYNQLWWKCGELKLLQTKESKQMQTWFNVLLHDSLNYEESKINKEI